MAGSAADRALAAKEAEFIQRGLRSQRWPHDVLALADVDSLRVPVSEDKVAPVISPESVHGVAL
eukprot:13593079-Alexandrium_andersonii.AAC.1